MKAACMSTCRDPENRSRKRCVCGGHSTGARKKRKPWQRNGASSNGRTTGSGPVNGGSSPSAPSHAPVA